MRRTLPCLLAQAALALAAFADSPGAAHAPATLPTPYTTEQIRDAWQPGLSVEMRVIAAGGESRRRLTVVSATPDAVVIREESVAANGAASEPPTESSARWSELRDHALFEASKATRERAECRSQLGAMPGWRYVVPQADGSTVTMCFADATPGPPVEYEAARDGKRLLRMEHTTYGRPKNGAEEKL
jgi:hypothetical protein